MSVMLFLLACVATLMSLGVFAQSTSAIHQILAAVIGLAAAVLLGFACVVAAVDQMAKQLKTEKPKSDYLKYVPCPHCSAQIAPDAKVCRECGRTPPWVEAAA